MNNIVCAIEQEAKFMNDSIEERSQYRKGYLQALGVVAEFLSLQETGGGIVGRKPTCSAVARLLSSVTLNVEDALCGTRQLRAKPSRARKAKGSSNKENVHSLASEPAMRPGDKREDFLLVGQMTTQGKGLLQLALGVLRSNSDYAVFLNFWLEDYGRQIVSPNPPPPLFFQSCQFAEELLQTVADAPAYVN